jgi:hypothetical protein
LYYHLIAQKLNVPFVFGVARLLTQQDEMEKLYNEKKTTTKDSNGLTNHVCGHMVMQKKLSEAQENFVM